MNFHVYQNWSNYVPTTANCDWLIYDRHVPVIFSIFPPFRNFTSQHPDIHVGYLPGPLPPHIELQRWLSEINNDTRKDANQSNKMKTYRLFKTIDNYVSVKSKLQHAPPGQPPGHLTFLKIIVQIPPYPGQNAVQMPHTRVHSGDQIPPLWGHFTGTKMTEGWQNCLQL